MSAFSVVISLPICAYFQILNRALYMLLLILATVQLCSW